MFNASNDAKEITLPEGKGKWQVYIDDSAAGTKKLYACDTTATVKPISALVLVRGGKTAGGFGKWGLVGGIIGGAAVLAGAGALILRKKKTS